MSTIRQTIAFTAGAAAVVAGIGFGAFAMADSDPVVTSQSPTSTTSENSLAGSTFLIECVEDNVVQEPTSFTLACADANESLDQLTWSDWGADQATATGVVTSNDCDPTCTEGTPQDYPVTVVASALEKGEAAQSYTKLTVTFTGERPEGAASVEVFDVIGVEPMGEDLAS